MTSIRVNTTNHSMDMKKRNGSSYVYHDTIPFTKQKEQQQLATDPQRLGKIPQLSLMFLLLGVAVLSCTESKYSDNV